jgi:ribosomal protein L14E/L6E/L27E
MVGKMAKVKAGHDKDKIYIIVQDDEQFVYLADGKLKTLQNPKKKSKKHIQPILHKIDETLALKLQTNDKVIDEEIKKAVKDYLTLQNM